MNEDLLGRESFLVRLPTSVMFCLVIAYLLYKELCLFVSFSSSGLPATEIHVCGSGIAVDVVKKIVESVGEQIEVKYYDRLLPLVTLNDSLGQCACKGTLQNFENDFLKYFFFFRTVIIFREVSFYERIL